jgi:cytochrome c oxidase cbb3-type subunit 1
MTTAFPAAVTADAREIDASSRCALSLLFASALAWLLVSGVLAIVNLIQAQAPGFLADCEIFTYGRTHAYQETVFIYGWAANAGFAVALWVVGRLGGAPMRSMNWAIVGTLFWNTAVTLGVIGIATGDGTSIPFLHLPRAVLPLMLVAYAAIALPAVLAWTGRRQQTTFAAQWYALAALFLFPWLFSAAQVVLLWAEPMRGVLQAIAAGWFMQGAWTLWLAPLALAAAYYLVPKITGRTIPHYDFAPVSFWVLLVIGGWTGGRHLIGGPVPAWIASMAVVSCTLLTFHYIVVAINLRGAFGQGGTALRFVAFGLAAYVIGGFLDAVTAFRSIAEFTQFTWVDQAQSQLALTGAFSMIVFGALYFLGPRLANRPWPSLALIRAHFGAAVLGTIGLVISLAVAGLVQGRGLADAAVTFATIADDTRIWLQIAVASQALLLLGNLLLAFHFVRLLKTQSAVPAAGLFRQPPTMEASVS